MSYLLSLRKFLRVHPYFATFFGGGLFVLSAIAAIVWRFSYFYSSFVIGLFLFFDAATHLLDKSISFSSNLNRIGKTFWMVLFFFIFFTDLVAGQIIFSVWQYPPYKGFINWVLLYLIIYPVGGLSLIAMFRFFDLLFGKIFPGKFFQIKEAARFTKKTLKIILLALPVAMMIPVGLYFSKLVEIFAQNQVLYSFIFIFLFFEWTFFFDILILAFGGKPILLDLIRGEKKVFLAILVSGLLGAFLHEVINTFVHEWVYVTKNFPVTPATFLGVPVVVFVAWIPLTIVCVQAYRLGTVIKEGGLLETLKKEYFT